MPWFTDAFNGRLLILSALILPFVWWYLIGLTIEDKKERYAWNWAILPATILFMTILLSVGH